MRKLTCRPIAPEHAPVSRTTHTATPQSLLGLSQSLYGRCPPAALISIPGECFVVGDSLSTHAVEGAEVALKLINALLDKRIREATHA
jgi:Ni,Fe-hydrogenase maturation factor